MLSSEVVSDTQPYFMFSLRMLKPVFLSLANSMFLWFYECRMANLEKKVNKMHSFLS